MQRQHGCCIHRLNPQSRFSHSSPPGGRRFMAALRRRRCTNRPLTNGPFTHKDAPHPRAANENPRRNEFYGDFVFRHSARSAGPCRKDLEIQALRGRQIRPTLAASRTAVSATGTSNSSHPASRHDSTLPNQKRPFAWACRPWHGWDHKIRPSARSWPCRTCRFRPPPTRNRSRSSDSRRPGPRRSCRRRTHGSANVCPEWDRTHSPTWSSHRHRPPAQSTPTGSR